MGDQPWTTGASKRHPGGSGRRVPSIEALAGPVRQDLIEVNFNGQGTPAPGFQKTHWPGAPPLGNLPDPQKGRAVLGSVEAPDEKAAITAAIEKYGISDPERQKRLVAQRSG